MSILSRLFGKRYDNYELIARNVSYIYSTFNHKYKYRFRNDAEMWCVTIAINASAHIMMGHFGRRDVHSTYYFGTTNQCVLETTACDIYPVICDRLTWLTNAIMNIEAWMFRAMEPTMPSDDIVGAIICNREAIDRVVRDTVRGVESSTLTLSEYDVAINKTLSNPDRHNVLRLWNLFPTNKRNDDSQSDVVIN